MEPMQIVAEYDSNFVERNFPKGELLQLKDIDF